MSFISTMLLQAAAPAADSAAKGGGSGMLMNVLFIGLMIAVFYFFMIRPQKKKQEEQGKFTDNVKRGDKVVTIGGIVGKIAEIRDKTFILDIEGGGKIQILRSAISYENSKAINAEAAEKVEEKKD
ncbi:MAG: preprotein translocase subunit YajC [Bacteroidia bacterium]|nr:preprotein translocase subunit YajC [Bacteroidia bacterium]